MVFVESHILPKHSAITKTLAYHSGEPVNPRVLVLAPTGVPAINVNGNTIHSGLGIPVGNFRKSIPKLNEKKQSTLRHQPSEVKVILIDEISMVSNYLLLLTHQRLKMHGLFMENIKILY